MALKFDTDFSISRLFLTKEVRLFIIDLETSDGQVLTFVAPTIATAYLDERFSLVYRLITMDEDELSKKIGLKIKDSFQLIDLILFKLGFYAQFSHLREDIEYFLTILFKGAEIKYEHLVINIDGVTITKEIWEYFIYVLKLCYGERASKPQAMPSLENMSEEARKFFLAQQEMEKKLQKIRKTGKHYDSSGKLINNEFDDGIAKIFLTIIYEFPSLTFDYLYQQTMAQILWLQRYAAGAMSYEVNAQAFAAGNFKKGKKLEPFIK